MTTHNQSVQHQFGHTAANYAISSVHVQGSDLEAMLKAVVLSGDETVLDAGCGAGHTALAFAPHVQEVVAYDLTEAMLEQVERLATERHLKNVRTRLGDVEQLPFDDNGFDLVVSRYSAHHWPHPQVAVTEYARVLKPGGAFILGDVVAFDDHTQDTFLQTIELLRDPSHVRDHSVSQWQTMIRNAGMSSQVILNFDISLDFNDWIERMRTPSNQAAMIKRLWVDAPPDIQAAFGLESGWDTADNFTFTIIGAVLHAQFRP